VRAVWVNQLGGLTFECVGAGQFVKWAPPGVDLGLPEEAERLRWASAFARVPTVLDMGITDDGASWLCTTAVPGSNAVSDRWKAEPRAAVRAIGEGLRALHETLPVDSCPFSWSAQSRLARARRHELDPARWHPSHRHLSAEEALALVAEPPSVDHVVVCHGDACAPNTLIDDAGRCSGHVDFGRMGTADRWADIAIATWSATWNFGDGWEDELLAAYGVPLDPDRTRYYRLLWDLTD
jgi:kanamycin kinase